MAYNDDSVLARLSALNESHDSIATAAQWIMFHRRHADHTVSLWMQRLKDSSSTRRLSLIYLANEVAQQSRIRHKEDFILSFSPVIAEAASVAYKGAPAEIQAKLRRVIDVWKDRSIFEKPIQDAIESRLGEMDKARAPTKTRFGSSPFGASSAIPPEFTSPIASHQLAVKLSGPLQGTIAAADQEYKKQMDPSTAVPSAPVYAARLNGLLKTLASAESAVAECVKARESLISGLEKLLEVNRTALESDRQAVSELSTRKSQIEEKKQQVELAIMRALGPSDGSGFPRQGEAVGNPPTEPDRPEMEALTPPPLEAFTPPEMDDLQLEGMNASDDKSADEKDQDEPSSAAAPGIEMLSQVASTYQSLPISTNGSNKRRRTDNGEFPDFEGDDGIDAEVAEMLKGNADV